MRIKPHTVLEDCFDVFHGRDVFRGIACDHHQVRLFSRGDRADAVLAAQVLRAIPRINLDRLHRSETSFHQELTGGPTLTIGNLAPTVSAGGSIPLGVQVTPADADDTVSVTITGLTSYETITDNLDQTIFSGGSVTLSAAEVNSGLTLHSSYGGTGHPVNNLIVTASSTTSGEAAAPATQTIVVTDPPVIASSPPPPTLPTPRTVATADFGPHVGAPPTGLAPSAYTTLAGLLDQYMAAGSRHNAPGVTSWTASQQAWLGGDKEFLTRPHG